MCVIIVIATEAIATTSKRTTKQRYTTALAEAKDPNEIETISITYFRTMQFVDVARVATYGALFIGGILLYNIEALSYLVIILGALTVALKEIVASMVGYLFVLYGYRVGDDVRVAGQLGEIVRIRLLSTDIAGEDENGEHNGKLYTIPNYHFYQGTVERQELNVSAFRHTALSIVFTNEKYLLPFNEWIAALKAFLDATLPVRATADVGYFRGFTGARYKLNYAYDTSGNLVVSIAFVSSTKTTLQKKEKIVTYIESTKRQHKEKK